MAEIDRWHTRISNGGDIAVQDREGRKIGEGAGWKGGRLWVVRDWEMEKACEARGRGRIKYREDGRACSRERLLWTRRKCYTFPR